MGAFESPAEEIGTYHTENVGDFLREALAEKFPTTTIEVVPITREGNRMFDMIVKTDPLTAGEMRAYVTGFFRAYNHRHKFVG